MGIKHTTQINPVTYPDFPEKELGTNEWNDDHVINGEIVLSLPTEGITTSSGNVGVFADKIGGRMMVSTISPSGQTTALQPFLGRNKISMCTANINSTTLTNFGLNVTGLGTAGATNINPISTFYNTKRIAFLGVADSTTSIAGWRSNANQFFLSEGGNKLGGIFYVVNFGLDSLTNLSDCVFFTGLSGNPGISSIAAGNLDFVSNTVGVGCDTAIYGNNLYFVAKFGTGAPNPVTQMYFLPSAPLTDTLYQLIIFSAPGSGSVTIQLIDLDNQYILGTWTSSASIPTNGTLGPHGFVAANGINTNTAAYVFSSLYIETDY